LKNHNRRDQPGKQTLEKRVTAWTSKKQDSEKHHAMDFLNTVMNLWVSNQVRVP
jgi:hypothetical protein